MSKLASSLGLASPGSDGDAFSMHSHRGDPFLDIDAPEIQDDDLPPLYDESEVEARLLPREPAEPGFLVIDPMKKDGNNGIAYFMDPRLDTEPETLENQVKWWARSPPRPFVRISGTHQETVDNVGKKERKRIIDFDISIELTPYLYSNAVTRTSWTELRTVENEEKCRRGTVLRKRAPGATQHVELGNTKPTLAEWCHRYCASHAGLKAFVFQRKVVGLDEQGIKERLEGLVSSTNYRGHVDISFPVKDDTCIVYNDCRTNKWRLTAWIVWMTMITLTFIFTWPYLFFRTKRFEVAIAEWKFSKQTPQGTRQFVSISEDQWYNLWGRAINKAVLAKRQGTLDQQDLITSDAPDPTFDNPMVDGVSGIVRAGVRAMNEVNRQLGWGGDS
ncbi:hypothetical protein GE09DRAFT_7590 [Coniochaeta sp. 2T2.1]|nr:hypothetical protein GE09DRAFT_7590 [Coniochaeta sp. 2T2.1]